MVVEKSAKVLTIFVMRFDCGTMTDGRVVKYSGHVGFEDTVELQTWTEVGGGAIQREKYELYGVVVHRGDTPKTGHYYSYTKAPTAAQVSEHLSSAMT